MKHKKKPIKHIPKHMKMPMFKNTLFTRRLRERELINKGYTIPVKYLGYK